MTTATCGSAEIFPEGVIDAHHHLYARPGINYLAEEYISDLTSTPIRFRGSIHVQARSHYRTTGAEAYRPLGETEFLLSEAQRAETLGYPGLCLGIVGYADLTLGAAVRPVVEGHLQLAGHVREGGRFCGVRHILAWDSDARLLSPAYPTTEGMIHDSRFREGLRVLAELDLAFDAWLLAPQLPQLLRLAQSMPDLRIVLNHCGGPVGTGAYTGQLPEVFQHWSVAIAQLAECRNVFVKLGGLGMPLSGLVPDNAPENLPTELVRLWRPWTDRLLDTFGPRRLMLESNAPADRTMYPFAAGWAAFGQILAPLTPDERQSLCAGTAERAYSLARPTPQAPWRPGP